VTGRSDAYEVIRRDMLARLERRQLHPDRDAAEVRRETERAVDAYQQRAHLGDHVPLHDPVDMVERVVRSISELGPLSELLARPDVEEIFIEGARVSYLDAHGRLRGLVLPTSEEENRQILEARVLNGSARLSAAIPPVADALSATLRRYLVRDVTLAALVAAGSLTAGGAEFLAAVMRFRSRIAVSGEPGSGKTTMVAALLAAAPPEHCTRCCEEVRELAVPFTHGAYYEARPPAFDGSGEITLRQLVKFVLAMRPDRIVVGEVRGAEAFELTRAVNAGCGFLCTVHANSAPDALHALVNAALMAGENVTEKVVQRIFAQALDLVVHLERHDSNATGDPARTARRRVAAITAVVPSLGDDFTCEPIFAREQAEGPLVWTGALPDRLARRADTALGREGSLRRNLERSS
jgi:pilus assembly protein CpaF